MAEELVPRRFQKGVDAVKSLAQLPRYEAAFIFGSVAEGTSNDRSDLDVRVITYQTKYEGRQPIEENNCDCATCRQDLKALLAAT